MVDKYAIINIVAIIKAQIIQQVILFEKTLIKNEQSVITKEIKQRIIKCVFKRLNFLIKLFTKFIFWESIGLLFSWDLNTSVNDVNSLFLLSRKEYNTVNNVTVIPKIPIPNPNTTFIALFASCIVACNVIVNNGAKPFNYKITVIDLF